MNTDQKTKTDHVTYPFFIGHLPPEFAKKAEVELGETPQLRKQSVQEVRELLRNENDIQDEWFTDNDITMYLRVRKFHVEKTVSSIKKMVAFVRSYREYYFEALDPKVLKKCNDIGYATALPQRTEDGSIVVVLRLGTWNPSELSVNDLMSYLTMCILRMLVDPMTQVNGIVLICDFKADIMRYLRYFNPAFGYRLYRVFMECTPLRWKAVHLINSTMLGKLAISIVRAIGSEKLSKRFIIHDKPEGINNHLQSNTVPMEYGGDVCLKGFKNEWTETVAMPDFINCILKSKK